MLCRQCAEQKHNPSQAASLLRQVTSTAPLHSKKLPGFCHLTSYEMSSIGHENETVLTKEKDTKVLNPDTVSRIQEWDDGNTGHFMQPAFLK